MENQKIFGLTRHYARPDNQGFLLRLVGRFGWERLFQAAKNVEESRRSRWIAYCKTNPHEGGTLGIYQPHAISLSRRWQHAHSVASCLYHEFLSPNDQRVAPATEADARNQK